MPRLTDPWFEAEFYGDATEYSHRRQGAELDGAQGLWLWCPCGYPNDHSAHGLIIPFANPRNASLPPENHGPISRDGTKHPRWTMSGSGLEDLTISPSVPSCWHGHIQNGEVT